MSFIDERTKGNNKEVITKILQTAYDRGFATKKDTETIKSELVNLSPMYEGIEISYRKEDIDTEE
ncbi:MAG: hypothetical protein J6Q87_03965 [Clostridia bacterium]|nr:hypothetical protein [Clostridia bacterium]